MAGMIGQAMAGAQAGAQQAAAAPAAAAVPDVMTLAEAAAYLKVSEADVQGLIDGGEIKAKKIGSEFRISKKVLDDFLAG
jgi:excisionase family DNA binding protein